MTPADIARSKANLPADTTFVVVPGASHASFGSYGRQPGDGTPTADPGAVQDQVAAATVDLLDGDHARGEVGRPSSLGSAA